MILDVQLWELRTQMLHQGLSETILVNTLTDVRELKNVKIIVTTPKLSEKKTIPFLGAKKIAPFLNYPTPAPVLNGTARSAKNSIFIIFIKKVSQIGMKFPPPLYIPKIICFFRKTAFLLASRCCPTWRNSCMLLTMQGILQSLPSMFPHFEEYHLDPPSILLFPKRKMCWS